MTMKPKTNNHSICVSNGSHLKLAKALSIFFSIISVYSCAEKSKEVGCGDLMQCETIEVMEFGVRGGVTGVEFQWDIIGVLSGLHFGEDDIGGICSDLLEMVWQYSMLAFSSLNSELIVLIKGSFFPFSSFWFNFPISDSSLVLHIQIQTFLLYNF